MSTDYILNILVSKLDILFVMSTKWLYTNSVGKFYQQLVTVTNLCIFAAFVRGMYLRHLS